MRACSSSITVGRVRINCALLLCCGVGDRLGSRHLVLVTAEAARLFGGGSKSSRGCLGMSRSRPGLCQQRRDGGHLVCVHNVLEGHLEVVGVGVAVDSARGYAGAPTVEALLALHYVPHAGDRRGVELLDRVECASWTDHVGSHGDSLRIELTGWRRGVGVW